MRHLIWGVVALLTLAACESTDDGAGGDVSADSGSRGEGADAAPDGGSGGSGGRASLDPAPQFNTPGEYGCEGCPDTPVDVFTRTLSMQTSTALVGPVTGAAGNGQLYVRGPGGEELLLPLPTTAAGDYAIELPLFCGTQLVKCIWSNDAGTYVLVTEVVTTDCREPDIRVTLSWDALGDDFELHLVREGGKINQPGEDCTWTTCVGAGPDWGAAGDASDDPLKDVDDTGDYGPENIFLAGAAPGVYTVLVEHWDTGDPLADGEVTIFSGGASTRLTLTDLAPKHVVTVATVEWPSGRVTPVGGETDCTASWNGGCTLPLP